jgi:hypothetical protein
MSAGARAEVQSTEVVREPADVLAREFAAAETNADTVRMLRVGRAEGDARPSHRKQRGYERCDHKRLVRFPSGPIRISTASDSLDIARRETTPEPGADATCPASWRDPVAMDSMGRLSTPERALI